MLHHQSTDPEMGLKAYNRRNSQELEATSVSIDGWVEKMPTIYTQQNTAQP